MAIHSGIHVFVNNRKIGLPANRITGAEILQLAGFNTTEHWDLYQLHSETDPTGGTMVSAGDVLKIKDGDWFRVIQGHHTRK